MCRGNGLGYKYTIKYHNYKKTKKQKPSPKPTQAPLYIIDT